MSTTNSPSLVVLRECVVCIARPRHPQKLLFHTSSFHHTSVIVAAALLLTSSPVFSLPIIPALFHPQPSLLIPIFILRTFLFLITSVAFATTTYLLLFNIVMPIQESYRSKLNIIHITNSTNPHSPHVNNPTLPEIKSTRQSFI